MCSMECISEKKGCLSLWDGEAGEVVFTGVGSRTQVPSGTPSFLVPPMVQSVAPSKDLPAHPSVLISPFTSTLCQEDLNVHSPSTLSQCSPTS